MFSLCVNFIELIAGRDLLFLGKFRESRQRERKFHAIYSISISTSWHSEHSACTLKDPPCYDIISVFYVHKDFKQLWCPTPLWLGVRCKRSVCIYRRNLPSPRLMRYQKRDLPNTFWSHKRIHIWRVIKWIFKESKGDWYMCIRVWIASLINAKNPRSTVARYWRWWWWHKGKSSNESDWRINWRSTTYKCFCAQSTKKPFKKISK